MSKRLISNKTDNNNSENLNYPAAVGEIAVPSVMRNPPWVDL
jgi:hypothetical protein